MISSRFVFFLCMFILSLGSISVEEGKFQIEELRKKGGPLWDAKMRDMISPYLAMVYDGAVTPKSVITKMKINRIHPLAIKLFQRTVLKNVQNQSSDIPTYQTLSQPALFYELFGGTPPDILSFTRDATRNDILRARSNSVKRNAQQLVANGTVGSAVWFKHMRKAGGSTVRDFLKNVYKHKRLLLYGNLSLNMIESKSHMVTTGFTLHHQEFDLFPVKCLVTTPNIVYITTIRDPISRIVSLFYYDGPGFHNYHGDETGFLNEVWEAWLNKGVEYSHFKHLDNKYDDDDQLNASRIGDRKRKRTNKSTIGFTGAYAYLPNYFTVSLTMQCIVSAGENSCARDNRGQSDFGTPGCKIKKRIIVDEELLLLAKTVLESFDAVLVVELFNLQGSSLLLQQLLNEPDVWLGHSRSNHQIASQKLLNHSAKRMMMIPTAIKTRLEEENKVDIELYQYMKRLSLSQFQEINNELKKRFGDHMNHKNAFSKVAALSSPSIER